MIHLGDQVHEGAQRFIWVTKYKKGHNDSFGHKGSCRGVTPPKGMMVHDCDLWSPHQGIRVDKQERNI
jgi:hypothetical protein